MLLLLVYLLLVTLVTSKNRPVVLPGAMNDGSFLDENGHDHVFVHFAPLLVYLDHLVNAHIAYHVS